MTRQDFSNDATQMFAENEYLTIERTFSAPRELVWTAMTSEKHLPNWVGPQETKTIVTAWDFRVGGTWRWINSHEGGQVAFYGEFLEIDAPKKLVRTEIFEMDSPNLKGPPAIETITFDALDGNTRVLWLTQFPSAEVLNFAIQQGMAYGALAQMDRLQQLLDDVPPATTTGERA